MGSINRPIELNTCFVSLHYTKRIDRCSYKQYDRQNIRTCHVFYKKTFLPKASCRDTFVVFKISSIFVAHANRLSFKTTPHCLFKMFEKRNGQHKY